LFGNIEKKRKKLKKIEKTVDKKDDHVVFYPSAQGTEPTRVRAVERRNLENDTE